MCASGVGRVVLPAIAGVVRGALSRSLFLASLSFAAGIGLAQALPVSRSFPAAVLAAAFLALALLGHRRFPILSVLLLLPGFAFAGYAAAEVRSRTHGAPIFGDGGDIEITVEGTLPQAPMVRPDGLGFVAHIDSVEATPGRWRDASFSLRVTRNGRQEPSLHRGDRVRMRLALSPISPPMNPGAPDHRRRLASEGVVAQGRVVEGQLALMGPPDPWESFLERHRDAFRDVLARAVPAEAPRALVAAMAVGDRASLSEETIEAFSASGLIHILSVSGLHVAVVAGGLFRLLAWLLRRSTWLLSRADPRALAAIASLPPIVWYVLLTGAEPPAVRSGLMAGALLLGVVFRRDADTLTSLGLALLLALAYDPASLQALSFQLSFASVAGLILLFPPIRRVLRRGTELWPRPAPMSLLPPVLREGLLWLREACVASVAASLAATLATGPLVAEAFHRTSYVSVLSNLVALPIASALTVFSAAAALLFPLSEAIAWLLAKAAWPFAWALLELGRIFAALPFAAETVASLPALAFIAWYALAAILGGTGPRQRLAAFAALVATVVLTGTLVHRELGPSVRRELAVTFFAIGQGDAALVQLPYGGALLIDAGGSTRGSFDPGQRILLPALAELRATRLDAFVLSHPDADHIGGATAVLKEFEVRELWHSPTAAEGPLFGPLARLAESRGTRLRSLARGEHFRTPGGATIEVLAPEAGSRLSPNDGSLVLRVSYKAHSFLFTGDIEAAGERHLLEKNDRPGLRATVLKAPHHGSDTSSSEPLVDAVSPEHVVFSVGRNNRFGFPRPEIVDRYARSGALGWRTDESGALRFVTDGERLTVTPFLEAAKAESRSAGDCRPRGRARFCHP